jgi:hypothetical protein
MDKRKQNFSKFASSVVNRYIKEGKYTPEEKALEEALIEELEKGRDFVLLG